MYCNFVDISCCRNNYRHPRKSSLFHKCDWPECSGEKKCNFLWHGWLVITDSLLFFDSYRRIQYLGEHLRWRFLQQWLTAESQNCFAKSSILDVHQGSEYASVHSSRLDCPSKLHASRDVFRILTNHSTKLYHRCLTGT